MNLHKMWGYGQMFGFSAFDGPNRYYDDFILMQMEEDLTLRVEFPHYLLISFPNAKNIQYETVMGDFIEAKIDGKPFLLTFADNDTIVGISPILPSITGEGEMEVKTDLGVEIFHLKNEWNHFLGLRYFKLDDGTYQFVIHHSFRFTEARAGANDYLHSDVKSIIKNKRAYYENMPECLDKKYESIYYKALSINKINTHSSEGKIPYFWTTPDRVPHRHMWLWDTGFHCITMTYYNQEKAKEAMLSMLYQMREDGFMPHMANPTDRSDVTQPCILSWAVYKMYEINRDKDFLKRCIYYLDKYLTWDIENRDVNHNGLLEWYVEKEYKNCRCGESGLDNAPRFDFDENMDAIDFSSYLALDSKYLSKIYHELGNAEKEQYWLGVHNKTKQAINDKLWNEEDGIYYDLLFSNKHNYELTPMSFLPMFAEIASKEQAEKMVKVLTNRELLWGAVPFSTVPQNHRAYSNDMWRGGVWLNLNYFIIEGLMNYGYVELAKQIRDETLEMVNKWYQLTGNIFEFYDPKNEVVPFNCFRKGDPLPKPDYRKHVHAITDYNWSACFTILLIQNIY